MMTQDNQNAFIFELITSHGEMTPYRNVSFVNYPRWCNMARDALLHWDKLGIDESLKNSYELDVLSCDVRYISESRLPNDILIKVNSVDITGSEFVLLFSIYQKKDGVLISHAKQRLKIYDHTSGKHIPLSKNIINNVLNPIEMDEKIWLNRQK